MSAEQGEPTSLISGGAAKREAILSRFEEAWQRGGRPNIDDYVAGEGDERQAILMELVRVDLERRLKAGQQVRVEEYLRQYPDLARDDERLIELIALECSQRRRADPELTIDEYLRRFPQHQAELANRLAPEDSSRPRQIGRYHVERLLGQGGFGRVYLARDDQLQRRVAIKVPHAALVPRAEDAEAYLVEARTLASLDHPHIVPVYDVGSSEEHPCYVVSKYVEGTDLAARMKRNRPSHLEAAQWMAAVAEALHYAHKRGLVHRDVKPGNILIDAEGEPFVVDFGLALREQDIGRGAKYAGTPAYWSPEQARGEGHRVDGRSDIFSLGVVFYELLTGRNPFRAERGPELIEEITAYEPRPPRQLDDRIPKELERICLKALSKRASNRYTTAMDMAEDLGRFVSHTPRMGREGLEDSARDRSSPALAAAGVETAAGGDAPPRAPGSDRPPIRIVPKGLRPFDEHDANFFLDLLPGPRDRNGLPESLRFWKTRIEETDAASTFSVGLIYGPSGCGKSSLVRAGLLPLLAEHVIRVYVEAAPNETEGRLFARLRQRCPGLPENFTLAQTVAALRQGRGIPVGKKVLIVLDQFEQWLHARREEEGTELVQALRQCDAGRVQCVVMVRDDFWLAVSRFMQALEIRLVEGRNSALVDLFDADHAKKVLAAFGRAFGRLPQVPSETTAEQKNFLGRAIAGLAEDGKVVSVRLGLFAEMMKAKTWTPATLRKAGGAQGVGVEFLEETFSASTAPPECRLHQKAARAVLKALLPESGTEIRAQMRRYDDLLAASGYAGRTASFEELVRILDQETRLITPTDPEGVAADEDSAAPAKAGGKYYQLTHDYLVPSLRNWLTRKQRETPRGRAELRLSERSAAWNAKPETRHLPNVFEWINIRCLTDSETWTEPQRRMMGKAARLHAAFWGGIFALLLMAGVAIQQYVAHRQREMNVENTITAVDGIQAATGQAIPFLLEKLDVLPRQLVQKELQARFAEAEGQQKLSLAYAMARFDRVEIDTLIAGIVDRGIQASEASNIVTALDGAKRRAPPKLALAAASASAAENWQAKARLAVVAMCFGDASMAAEVLQAHPSRSAPQLLQNPLAKFRQELAAMEKLSPEEQNRPQVRLSRARAHYYLDRWKEAKQDLDELVAGESVPVEAWLLQALCLAREGSAHEAEEAAARLASGVQSQSKSYAASGHILSRAWLGYFEEAKRQLEQLAADDANDAQTQYNGACMASQLARICAGSDPTEAGRLKRRALELLRRAYRKRGFRAGIQNDPDFAPIYDDPDFQALACEFEPPVWDPVQRTEFIAEFPKWCWRIETLAGMLQQMDTPDIHSGMSLAIGSIERPDPQAKEAWQKVLAGWYSKDVESGTHSAAGWALRKWKCALPPVERTVQPPSQRDWWHTPLGLTLLRIPPRKSAHADEDRPTAKAPTVRIAEFFLSDREVSVGLFEQFMADGEYNQKFPGETPKDWQGCDRRVSPTAEHPVQCVSWYDAVMFCNWLSRKEGRQPCYEKTGSKEKPPFSEYDDWRLIENANGYRLPSQAQWEYACRAGSTTVYAMGDDAARLASYAVYGARRAEPWGSKLCNAWGLFDMHGNVWEWCGDRLADSGRVARGGGWSGDTGDCRSSYRSTYDPPARYGNLGFRVALVPFRPLTPP